MFIVSLRSNVGDLRNRVIRRQWSWVESERALVLILLILDLQVNLVVINNWYLNNNRIELRIYLCTMFAPVLQSKLEFKKQLSLDSESFSFRCG